MTENGTAPRNPFLQEWATPYGIPDYAQVRNEDYLPAVKAGIAQQQAEIAAITANSEPATFENTIGTYERSGAILDRVTGVLFNLCESDVTDELQEVVEEVLPLLTEHEDNIFMDPALYERVAAIYRQQFPAQPAQPAEPQGQAAQPQGQAAQPQAPAAQPQDHAPAAEVLTPEQRMVVKNMYDAFVRNGVSLDATGQARVKAINKRVAVLEQKFGNNLLAANNDFEARFGVAVSEYSEAMASTADRARREEMFRAYSTRCQGGPHDNLPIITEVMRLRIEKAHLLGADTPANFILQDKMAHDSATVDRFLAEIMQAALVKARAEVVEMQELMDKDQANGILPPGAKIEAWDWAWYAEKVRKEKYDLDEDELRPYFQMEKVREGVFNTAHRLYGLNFRKVDDAPLYHPEVEVFEVTDAGAVTAEETAGQDGGRLIGYLMTDYFPRATKRGGAWMNNVRNQEYLDGKNIRPIIVNVGNFARPADGKPSLLTLDQVETMFHEFGHALHGLLSQCHYKSVSGTEVARDFVEFPSQINENWAFQKEVLEGYARHWQTGEVIPASLARKIHAAKTFNQGFMTTELCAASILDMKWHELGELPEGTDPLAFEEKVCADMGLIGEIIPRYRTSYFAHIFNSGYNAGYYSYLWAEVLDKDAFELFLEKGIFDPETAAAFRRNILEKGGSEDPMELYRRFRGGDPDPDALLRARGLM